MTATSPPTVNTDSVSPPVETNRQQIPEQTERAISDYVEGAVARTFASLTILHPSGILREKSESGSSALSQEQKSWESFASSALIVS